MANVDLRDREFRLRPRKPKRTPDESKAWCRPFQNLMRLVRMTSKRSGSPVPRVHRSHYQRCAVRLTYSPNRVTGQWAAHGRYIARESATRPTEEIEAGFSSDRAGVPVAKQLGTWQSAGDPRLFKVILSPEFGERLDLRRLTRETMAEAQRQLGRTLEWVAVAHFNTEHPHVHIALRGVADGHALRLDKEFVKRGLRTIAAEECTRQLGFRTKEDTMESERREVRTVGPTSLDRRLDALRRENGSNVLTLPPGEKTHLLRARLALLESLGFAEPRRNHEWSLADGLLPTLRDLQRSADHLRTSPPSQPRKPVRSRTGSRDRQQDR